MQDFANGWTEALTRASLQGGLAIAAFLLLFKLMPRISPQVQVWCWRILLLKMPLSLLLSIRIEEGRTVAGAGRTAQPLFELIVLFLSALCVLVVLVDIGTQVAWSRRLRTLNAVAEEWVSGGRKLVQVRYSNQITGPMLVGIRKPVILLPSFLLDSVSEKNAVIQHELAHIGRRDLVWNWLTVFSTALFSFHPLVWLANRELSIATERCCDEAAIRQAQISPGEYGRLLISLAQETPTFTYVRAAASATSTLSRRITALAKPSRHASRLAQAFCFLAAGLLLPTFRLQSTPIASTPTTIAWPPAAMVASPIVFERRTFAQVTPSGGENDTKTISHRK